MADWMDRRDEGGRLTYPPLPTTGGNPNAEASQGVVEGITIAFQRTQAQEAAFRARQYARRLHTRGKAAMCDPELSQPFPEPSVEIPDDPLAQSLHAAGWL